jgi:hypothetical protein
MDHADALGGVSPQKRANARFIADEHDVGVELLNSKQGSGYDLARGVVASHCVDRYARTPHGGSFWCGRPGILA